MKAGFVAIVGVPNAGKSTLMNLLIGEKVSIVTPKAQTTRQRITGILNAQGAQMVFVDAPGLIQAKAGLNKFLAEEAHDVISKADAVIALLPADSSPESAKKVLQSVRSGTKKWIVLITKADLLKGTQTPLFFKDLMEEQIPFVSISALTRPDEAREEILRRVIDLLPETKAPLFDEELYTTQTVRQMTAEIIRERCFENLHQEIPYSLAILIREFKEDLPILKISAEILVEKDGHKGIVIGAKGATLKKIGSEARQKLELLLERQVFLELHVTVKKDWSENKQLMKELGYVLRN